MKRNTWLALLAVVATTATAVSMPGAALADVECRYAMHPGFPAPMVLYPNELFNVSGVQAPASYDRPMQLQSPQWSVLALRPGSGADYDLGLDDCDFGFSHGLSKLAFRAVDFLAIDGRQPSRVRTFASVTNAGEAAGTFALEYSAGGPALQIGTSQTLTFRGTPAVVRDVVVRAGTSTTIVLRPTSGDLDLAVMASATSPETWVRSRLQAVQHSINPGLTEERVTLSAPAGRPDVTFGLVIVNNSASSMATLHRF